MKKLISSLLLAVIIIMQLAGCSSNKSSQSSTPQQKTFNTNQNTAMSERVLSKTPAGPPEIKITIDNKQLEYVVAKNIWDGVAYDREDTFESILKKTPESSIPYINIGSTVVIDFSDNPPDKLIVTDLIIYRNGNKIHFDKTTDSFPVELSNNIVSFKIARHTSSLSSSDIINKINIRGFRVIAKWGENECEYAFVIKTDAY